MKKKYIRDSEVLESRMYEPSCLTKAWKILTTGLIEPKGISSEESYIYQLRSLGMYIFHVILVFWVIYGTFDLEANYHSIILSDLITKSYFESRFISRNIKFNEIRAPKEIWDFIRGVILKIIYPVDTINSSHSILQDNELIGVAQLRQVRVKRDVNCKSAPLFRDLYKHCYGYICDENSEDTEPFGRNLSTPWRYSINDEKTATGQFCNFKGNGFALNFSKNYNLTLKQLDDLENNTWIRLGTRVVFLDFSLYCPNTNTFLLVKTTFELMPWGSVIPTLHIYSIKLLTSLNDAKAFLLLGVDLVLLGYTIGLNFMLFVRLKRTEWRMITYNNFIDVAIILSTYATLCVHITMVKYTDEKLNLFVKMVNKSGHVTFGILISTYTWYLTVAAVLLLCIVLKLIRYALFFNDTCRLLVCALTQVQGELICFTIMNLSALFGWGFIYCTIYGRVHLPLITPVKSLVHLIYHHASSFTIFDKGKARSLSFPMIVLRAISVPASVFYINCISQQTYVGLVVHGWQLVRRDCVRDPLKIKANEMVCTRIVLILETLKLHKLANQLQEHLIVKMNEGDYFPFTQILRRYGWTRLEIRVLLRKYGIRKGDDLTFDDLFEIYQDFWVRNALYFEVTAHEELKNDLEHMQRMIKYCDSTIADLKLSIERLADQFLNSKAKKKSATKEPSSESLASPSTKSMLGRYWK